MTHRAIFTTSKRRRHSYTATANTASRQTKAKSGQLLHVVQNLKNKAIHLFNLKLGRSSSVALYRRDPAIL
jgi:hypothetical protein